MPRFPNISSFFVAIFIYTSLVFAIFFALLDANERAQKYTDDRDAFMDVLVDVPEISAQVEQGEKDQPKQEIKPEPKQQEQAKDEEIAKEPEVKDPAPVEPEPPKEPEVISVPKEEPKPDLKELFSSIDTTKFKQEPKPKPAPEKKPSNEASKIVNSLKLDKSAKALKSQKTGVYNPLYGAIEKQIQRRWQSYKADSNNEASVRVSIDSSGRFSYEIIRLSYDSDFNAKVRECLELLSTEIFAHSSSTITLDLTLVDKLSR